MFHRFQAKYAPYLFVMPFLIIFGTFGLYPIIKSLVLSTYITAGPRSQIFVGYKNFYFLFTDPDFYKAVWNTGVFAFFSVFLQLPLALFLAVLLNSRAIGGRNIFRFAFFSPHLMGIVFASILFTLIFAENFGLLNVALDAALGATPDERNIVQSYIHYFLVHVVYGVEEWKSFSWLQFRWLGDRTLVMPAMIILSLWLYTGFNMIYFLAALQNVDESLYEAAKVDGANALQRFWHVTVPGIKPVIVFVVVLSTIGSFRLFELPWLLLGNTSGPDQAGLTIVMYLYQNGFITGDLGYASAIGWTLALGILLFTLLQIKLSGTMKKEA